MTNQLKISFNEVQKLELPVEYQVCFKINEIFPIYSMGIYTGRDNITIHEHKDDITKVIRAFMRLKVKDIQKRYRLVGGDSGWTVDTAQQDVKIHKLGAKYFTSMLYRPFDHKHTYYTGRNGGFIAIPRRETMRNMLSGKNLGLCTSRRLNDSFQHVLCGRNITHNYIFFSNHEEGAYLLPLYRYPEQEDNLFETVDSPWKLSDKGRWPNLSKNFVQEIVDKLSLSFITDGRGDLQETFGPEDIFHYAYAVLHSPTYRQRYAEFLKIDFPRLPLTNNLTLFRTLAQLGADLVALHLLEDDYEAASWTLEGEDSPLAQTGVEFISGKNGTTMGTIGKSTAWQKRRVYINTQTIKRNGSYFTGVPKSVWNFHIGDYQVCYKWLYDRRGIQLKPGRTLTPDDIEHYKRIVAAVRETKILMEAIDRTIDQHGGWPLTGSQPNRESEINEEQEEKIEMSVEPEKGVFDEKEKQNPDLTTDNVNIIIDHSLGIDHETEDSGEQRVVQPFDPTLIRVDTRPLTVDLLIRRIKNDEINLNPDFQRMGGIWSDVAQSRLIESLMIRIPLPAFYMDASDDEKWLVIDGLQRLTALKRFIIEQDLKLQNLEFWNDYNGLTFKELPRNLQRRIEETQVTLYLVQRGTPHNVKFNIFKRINTGGVPLSGQEIRHALNLGNSTDLLIELAKTKEFLQATDKSVSPKRMTDRECVLRFLAFTIKNYSDYGKRDELDPFLNDRMQEINRMPKKDINTLSRRFKRAMAAAHKILGKKAFRKQYRGRTRRSPISKALFEVWSVNLDRLNDAQIKKLTQKKYKDRLGDKFLDLMENAEFFNAITTSTGDPSRVKIRFSGIERIIKEVLNA
ncbi:DUF262 domain-containing protein [Anaerolineales bacterium HSG24]|nr:DUF262 domain-containing protein [Anaerolineales bacterium HSG24]